MSSNLQGVTNCSKKTPLKLQYQKIQILKPLNHFWTQNKHLSWDPSPVASAIEPPERRLRRLDNRRFTAPPATAVPPPAGRAVRRPSPPRLWGTAKHENRHSTGKAILLDIYISLWYKVYTYILLMKLYMQYVYNIWESWLTSFCWMWFKMLSNRMLTCRKWTNAMNISHTT